MQLLRQNEIGPRSPASPDVLLRTCLQLAQTYLSVCRQAQSVVGVASSRRSLSLSVARHFSPTVRLASVAELL